MTHDEYLQLQKSMRQWARAYYDGAPEISDEHWDVSYRALKVYEEQNPDKKLKDSIVGLVGLALFGASGKIKLNPPMLSLENAMSVEEASDFIEKEPFRLSRYLVKEYKADGNATRLIFNKGKYTGAVSRGDGVLGENISTNISPEFTGFPANIDDDLVTSVDGEIIITYASFNELNDERSKRGLEPYKNTRNAVAGLLRSDELEDYAKRAMSFVAYETHGRAVDSWMTNRQWLAQSGFKVVDLIPEPSFEKAVGQLLLDRDSLDYAIDGVVVKVDEYPLREKFGSTKHSPRWAFSYKFPAITATARLEETWFTVGRTGQITAMVRVSPTDIGGVTVTRCVVDSLQRWMELKIHKDCSLLLSRRADVRPYIEAVVNPKKDFEAIPFAAICPSCSKRLKVVGKKVFCTNNTCGGRQIAHAAFIAEKSVFDIDGISEATVGYLFASGVIKTVLGLFSLTKEALVSTGITEYSASKMVESIDKAKTTTIARIVKSMNIPSLGATYGGHIERYLIAKGVSVENLIAFLKDPKQIKEVFGDSVVGQNIIKHMSDPYLAVLVESYAKVGFKVKPPEGKLLGKKYCITGSLVAITRKSLEEKLIGQGAIVQSSVTAETTALITDDPVSPTQGATPSKKMERASALNIPIISSEEILKILE